MKSLMTLRPFKFGELWKSAFEDISPPGFMTIKVGLPKNLSPFEIRSLMEDMQSLINKRGISATVTTYHKYLPEKMVFIRDGLPEITQPKRGTFKAVDEKLDPRIGNPSWEPKISHAMPYGFYPRPEPRYATCDICGRAHGPIGGVCD